MKKSEFKKLIKECVKEIIKEQSSLQANLPSKLFYTLAGKSVDIENLDVYVDSVLTDISKNYDSITISGEGRSFNLSDKFVGNKLDLRPILIDILTKFYQGLQGKIPTARQLENIIYRGKLSEIEKRVSVGEGILIKGKVYVAANNIGNISETKYRLGETQYMNYNSWKRACKQSSPNCKFEGDRDICACISSDGKGIGEWDGEKGSVFKGIKEDAPCWDGYEQIGMKNKNGKEVPNCVPKK